MITIKNVNGNVGPFVMCDHCAAEISDASDASVIWQESLDPSRLPNDKFYFVHQYCDLEFEAAHAHQDKTWCSAELGTWLIYLTNNVRWNEAQSRKNAEMLDGITLS